MRMEVQCLKFFPGKIPTWKTEVMLLKAKYFNHTLALVTAVTVSSWRSPNMYNQCYPRACWNQLVAGLSRPARLQRTKNRNSPANLNCWSLEGTLRKVGKDYVKWLSYVRQEKLLTASKQEDCKQCLPFLQKQKDQPAQDSAVKHSFHEVPSGLESSTYI